MCESGTEIKMNNGYKSHHLDIILKKQSLSSILQGKVESDNKHEHHGINPNSKASDLHRPLHFTHFLCDLRNISLTYPTTTFVSSNCII